MYDVSCCYTADYPAGLAVLNPGRKNYARLFRYDFFLGIIFFFLFITQTFIFLIYIDDVFHATLGGQIISGHTENNLII